MNELVIIASHFDIALEHMVIRNVKADQSRVQPNVSLSGMLAGKIRLIARFAQVLLYVAQGLE